MIQVGIFTGIFPHPLEERAKRIRDLGFNTVAPEGLGQRFSPDKRERV